MISQNSLQNPEETSKSTQLLLAMNDQSYLAYLEKYLQNQGRIIVRALGLHEARSHLDASPVDVVIATNRLTDGSGLELINEFKNRRNGPGILICEENEPVMFQKAYQLGADALFLWPCDFELLERTISRLLLAKPRSRVQRWDRIHARYNLVIKRPGQDEVHHTETINLSQGGIFLSLDQDLPKPREVLEFRLYYDENSRPISGRGIVRWQKAESEAGKPRGIGIEFQDLGADDLDRISNLISGKSKLNQDL